MTDEAVRRLREDGPLHYFDCDRFNVYGYGARQGDCDCDASADVAAVLTALADCNERKRHE